LVDMVSNGKTGEEKPRSVSNIDLGVEEIDSKQISCSVLHEHRKMKKREENLKKR